MATGREERMASRMRGAQRHQVEDISFGLIIPPADEPPEPEPEPDASLAQQSPPTAPAPAHPRTTPNTSAQRRRSSRAKPPGASTRRSHQTVEPSPVPRPPSAAASRTRSEIYDIPDNTSEEAVAVSRLSTTSAKTARRQPSTLRQSLSHPPAADDADEMESLPLPGPTPTAASAAPERLSSARRTRTYTRARPTPGRSPGMVAVEEVGESPADAPGSGQRRVVMRGSGAAAATSALLQSVVGVHAEVEEDEITGEMGLGVGEETVDVARLAQGSSPLSRKSRLVMTGVRGGRRPGRRSVGFVAGGKGVGEEDELSPEGAGRSIGISKGKGQDGEVASLPATGRRRSTRLSTGTVLDQEDELSPEKTGEAEQPDFAKPSKRVTRKGKEPAQTPLTGPSRQSERRATTRKSIQETIQEQQEAPSWRTAEEQEEAQEIDEQEAARRLGRKRPRRSIPGPSPELDLQPAEEEPAAKKRRRKPPASPAVQRQGKPKTSESAKSARRKHDAVDELEADTATGTVPVTVQRFTRKVHRDATDPGADILGSEIPFANRGGVNAVDVLSQMCEVLIDSFLSNLEERARDAENSAARREFRTMMRALEAFREELRTRLLEQTIALDTLHALRKRVRVAQREKLALREEILRIRAERDQVGLRMDAVRIKHEADSNEAQREVHLSTTMHDIDLAIDKGLSAPALSPAQEKEAELANLELLISRVADQACSNSDAGGALRQVREFNSFLERAAAVLEGRIG